jgi:hypothetical protein
MDESEFRDIHHTCEIKVSDGHSPETAINTLRIMEILKKPIISFNEPRLAAMKSLPVISISSSYDHETFVRLWLKQVASASYATEAYQNLMRHITGLIADYNSAKAIDAQKSEQYYDIPNDGSEENTTRRHELNPGRIAAYARRFELGMMMSGWYYILRNPMLLLAA